MSSLFERPLGWLKRLPWIKKFVASEPNDDLTVEGCFTLPGARLDDLADEPANGPEPR